MPFSLTTFMYVLIGLIAEIPNRPGGEVDAKLAT